MDADHRYDLKEEGLYSIIPLGKLRRTPGVTFDFFPMERFPCFDGIDRVVHAPGAYSPGAVAEVARPWYMHTHQQDHLVVMHGRRTIELYAPGHGPVSVFEFSPQRVCRNGVLVYDGPAMLSWPAGVFHRVHSDPELGSASINFAVRHKGYDARTNFSIYDLDTATGQYRVIREGHLDQPQT